MVEKRHSVSVCKLCGCRDSSEDPNKKSSYFCSELVASIYKLMGVLTKERPSVRYMPGSFEGPGTNLRLTSGAYLGNELLIDFFLDA